MPRTWAVTARRWAGLKSAEMSGASQSRPKKLASTLGTMHRQRNTTSTKVSCQQKTPGSHRGFFISEVPTKRRHYPQAATVPATS